MKDLLLGQESAFPNDGNWANGNPEQGLSKRFYAACAAMQGLLSNPNRELRYDSMDMFIKDCYNHADELLKQEQNEKNN